MFVSGTVTAVGRHVEINLKLIHMASGVKTHTFGRHVERLEIVFMAVCGMSFNTRWAPCRRLQSRIMAKGKIPRKLGAM